MRSQDRSNALCVKDKDAKISALEKANAAMQRDVALMKKRLGM